MKRMSIWVASAALFLASMGICSCSMGSTTTSEMRGSLEFTQDDLREKPFKAIDVDVVASVYYTQNDGDECSVRLDYSAIKDAEFAQKLKEKLKEYESQNRSALAKTADLFVDEARKNLTKYAARTATDMLTAALDSKLKGTEYEGVAKMAKESFNLDAILKNATGKK